MKFLKLIPIIYIFFGNFPYKNLVHAEVKNPEEYKVLTTNGKNLSITNVKYYLSQGDLFIKNGDFDKAKDSYLDARIPNEMQKKGKETLQILAESNERLASLYVKNKKPEVAVPLLIEIIRIMSPSSPEGKEAYKTLIELGFVETTYKG